MIVVVIKIVYCLGTFILAMPQQKSTQFTQVRAQHPAFRQTNLPGKNINYIHSVANHEFKTAVTLVLMHKKLNH